MLTDEDSKLVRPRQLYVGATERRFVPVDARKEHRATVG